MHPLTHRLQGLEAIGRPRCMNADEFRASSPEKVLRATWGRDEAALQVLKAATSPTGTGDFPSLDVIGPFRSLVPGSAALKLFEASMARSKAPRSRPGTGSTPISR